MLWWCRQHHMRLGRWLQQFSLSPLFYVTYQMWLVSRKNITNHFYSSSWVWIWSSFSDKARIFKQINLSQLIHLVLYLLASHLSASPIVHSAKDHHHNIYFALTPHHLVDRQYWFLHGHWFPTVDRRPTDEMKKWKIRRTSHLTRLPTTMIQLAFKAN